METRSNLKIWVLIIGILLICSISALIVVIMVNRGIQDAQDVLAPINDFTGNLSTQVAQVLNPTPTIVPDPVTIISQIRTLARLETIQYSVEKVITAEIGQDAFKSLFGDRLLFIAHGVVIAGVDMMKIGPDDLWLENDVLYVRLPEAEIFIATLDNDKSYVYDRDTGILTHGDINLETSARRAAEDEIEKAAIQDGILEQAGVNAENYLYRLLRDLGYPDVIFEKAEPTPES
jgi:hypothetical protein